MRSRASIALSWGIKAGPLLAIPLVVACGRYGEASSEDGPSRSEDASPGPSTGGAEAGPGAADASGEDADVTIAGRTCTVFAASSLGGYVAQGNVDPNIAGVLLVIGGGTPTTIKRTYRAAAPIQRSTVEATIRIAIDGSWPDNSVGVGALGLFFGAGDSEATTPATRFNLRRNDVEMSVWHTANSPGQTNTIPIFQPWGNVRTETKISSVWGVAGSVDVAIGVFGDSFKLNTASGASDQLTVVFGGVGTDKTPTVRLTVESICVELL